MSEDKYWGICKLTTAGKVVGYTLGGISSLVFLSSSIALISSFYRFFNPGFSYGYSEQQNFKDLKRNLENTNFRLIAFIIACISLYLVRIYYKLLKGCYQSSARKTLPALRATYTLSIVAFTSGVLLGSPEFLFGYAFTVILFYFGGVLRKVHQSLEKNPQDTPPVFITIDNAAANPGPICANLPTNASAPPCYVENFPFQKF